MNPITHSLSIAIALIAGAVGQWVNVYLAAPIFVVSIFVVLSVKVAGVWQKFVILRVGKLHSVRGRGSDRPCRADVVARDNRLPDAGFASLGSSGRRYSPA
jgi:hypothetical protein